MEREGAACREDARLGRFMPSISSTGRVHGSKAVHRPPELRRFRRALTVEADSVCRAGRAHHQPGGGGLGADLDEYHFGYASPVSNRVTRDEVHDGDGQDTERTARCDPCTFEKGSGRRGPRAFGVVLPGAQDSVVVTRPIPLQGGRSCDGKGLWTDLP